MSRPSHRSPSRDSSGTRARRLSRGLGYALGAVAMAAAASCVDTGKEPTFAVGSHVDDWRDEIIYQVLIDRFEDGDINNDYRVDRAAPARYHGGDWRGLMNRLDYVQALGVTTLWISPIVRNIETDAGIDSYHGYWAQDLAELNQHFGNLGDLRALVAEAHRRGMKVVLDIVTNHMGQMFFYDINQNGRPDENISGYGGPCDPTTGKCSGPPGSTNTGSPVAHVTEWDPDYDHNGIQSFTSLGPAGPAPIIFLNMPEINRTVPSVPSYLPEQYILTVPAGYHRRGRIVNYDAPPDGDEQTQFGDFPGGLKDVATERDDVRALMIKAYGRWVELADLDGFRIDTVKHVEHEFWQVFNKGIRQKAASLGKKSFLMFGEVFDGRDKLVGSYTQNGELDTLFDFPQYFQVFRDVFIGGGSTKKIEARFTERKTNWGATPHDGGIGTAPVDMHVNFLDNHDVGRFLYFAKTAGRADAVGALWNALVFQFTENGIPCVYYGTEQEFAGGNDPANREDLWPTGFPTAGATFKRIARLSKIRKSVEALRRGTMTFTWTTDHTGDEGDAGLVAFERKSDGGGYALVVINTNAKHPSTTADGATTMTVTAPAGTVLVDALPETGGQTFTVDGTGKLSVQVPATSAMVLVPQGTKI
jgi:glycosidase